jgi:hypothetical protein
VGFHLLSPFVEGLLQALLCPLPAYRGRVCDEGPAGGDERAGAPTSQAGSSFRQRIIGLGGWREADLSCRKYSHAFRQKSKESGCFGFIVERQLFEGDSNEPHPSS